MAVGLIVKEVLKEAGKIALKELKASKYLKYADLFNFSKSELLKAGFSEKQILNKLSKFYLKEGWQLVINESKGQTIAKALRELKKGRLTYGVKLPKTAEMLVKQNLRNINKLIKQGKEISKFPAKLLNGWQKGEVSWVGLNNALKKYANNIEEYVNKDILTNETELAVDNIYNKMNYLTRQDIAEIYDESGY